MHTIQKMLRLIDYLTNLYHNKLQTHNMKHWQKPTYRKIMLSDQWNFRLVGEEPFTNVVDIVKKT